MWKRAVALSEKKAGRALHAAPLGDHVPGVACQAYEGPPPLACACVFLFYKQRLGRRTRAIAGCQTYEATATRGDVIRPPPFPIPERLTLPLAGRPRCA